MPISNPDKTVSNSALACDGLTTVTLSFDATPELSENPADIVLILDRSGSMQSIKLAQAKVAAKQLIQTVAKASGDPDGLTILNDTRLGIISFADTATIDTPLTGDVAALNAAVTALTANGKTNHTAAFEQGMALLQQSVSPRRILVMFTDGLTTVGEDPVALTDSIKASGVEIYCIGLDTDTTPLNSWASTPDSKYVAMAADVNEIEDAFAEIAAEVVMAGALDVNIREVLNPSFEIQKVNKPSCGIATVLDPQTLEWTADAVGATGAETATLSFEVKHINEVEGVKSVNQSITYTDRQGGTLTFPDPKVTVTCAAGGDPVIVEPCPEAANFQVKGCQDAAVFIANDAIISGLGRIVQVDTLVKNVCPGKRTAVAVALYEVDQHGMEHARGLKTVLIPPQSGHTCQDVQLKCISFVVPEALDVSGDTTSICNSRKFSVRVLANYVDTDFVCCDAQTSLV